MRVGDMRFRLGEVHEAEQDYGRFGQTRWNCLPSTGRCAKLPRLANDSITMRLYRERALYEPVRIIGYGGVEPFAFWDRVKELGLDKEIGKQKVLNTV